jgi:hypothetical protein
MTPFSFLSPDSSHAPPLQSPVATACVPGSAPAQLHEGGSHRRSLQPLQHRQALRLDACSAPFSSGPAPLLATAHLRTPHVSGQGMSGHGKALFGSPILHGSTGWCLLFAATTFLSQRMRHCTGVISTRSYQSLIDSECLPPCRG